MRAKFGIERERHNKLYYKHYENDKGAFHFHSQIELYFIDKGEMEVVVNEHRRTLTAGQLSVALSFDAHSYKTPKHSRSSVLIIPPYLCEEFISAVGHKKVTYPFITDTDAVLEIKKYFALLEDEQNEIKRRGFIHIILGTVMESLGFSRAESTVEPELSSKILFYINENFKSYISLSSLSSHFGYSESYISRYFKACFHIGISQYITVLRLKNAVMLIEEKKHSITYCAFESGFNSMRTFYRAFAEEFGCTPKEYIS